CRDKAALDIFMLYPKGRISEVQRRQMTTVEAANAHALAIEGTFDDCQDIVKALFADLALRRDLNLSAVNSINFARVAAQIVYYLAAGLALGAPARAVSFSVQIGRASCREGVWRTDRGGAMRNDEAASEARY